MSSFLGAHWEAEQLRDGIACARVHTERQAAFTNEVEDFRGPLDLGREEHRLDNDMDLSCQHYGRVNYDEFFGPYDLGSTLSDPALLYPPPQRQYGHLDPPASRGTCPPYHSPPLYGAANEELHFDRCGHRAGHDRPQYDGKGDAKLEFGERGRPLYRDPHLSDAAAKELRFGRRGRRHDRDPFSYDEADTWPEYGRHARHHNHSPPPYRAAENEFIFRDEQHGPINTYRPENDRLPFASGYMGLKDNDGGFFSDIYSDPSSPYCQRGLHTGGDMSPHHFDNFTLRPADHVPTLASGTSRPTIDRRVERTWTDCIWSSHTGSRDTKRNSREAPTHPSLETGPTGYGCGFQPLRDPAQDELTGTLRRLTLAETSRGATRDEAHDEFDTVERKRQRMTSQLIRGYPPEEVKIKHPRGGHRARRHPPIPHIARTGPSVTRPYGTGMASRPRTNFPYCRVTDSQFTPSILLSTHPDSLSNAIAMSEKICIDCTIKPLPQGEQHTHLDPNSQTEMDITTHELVSSDTELNIPRKAAGDKPHDIPSLPQASAGETNPFETSDSDSGYDTPKDDGDNDADSESSPTGDEKAQGSDWGLETVIRIQL